MEGKPNCLLLLFLLCVSFAVKRTDPLSEFSRIQRELAKLEEKRDALAKELREKYPLDKDENWVLYEVSPEVEFSSTSKKNKHYKLSMCFCGKRNKL